MKRLFEALGSLKRVRPERFELEPVRRRERSGSLLAKSRAFGARDLGCDEEIVIGAVGLCRACGARV